MTSDSMYIHVSNEGSSVSSYLKYAHDFEVTLPKTLYCPGQWEMALDNVYYQGHYISSPPKMLTVHCDLVDNNIINGIESQVLRRIPNVLSSGQPLHWQFEHLYYINLITTQIRSVRIRILDEKGLPTTLSPDSWIYCTLHLRKKNTLL